MTILIFLVKLCTKGYNPYNEVKQAVSLGKQSGANVNYRPFISLEVTLFKIQPFSPQKELVGLQKHHCPRQEESPACLAAAVAGSLLCPLLLDRVALVPILYVRGEKCWLGYCSHRVAGSCRRSCHRCCVSSYRQRVLAGTFMISSYSII